ncbi:MAG TPA: universal stress protein [Stellaceae bacterium]|nr:universal stress protein [Stellaceae bacterium]
MHLRTILAAVSGGSARAGVIEIGCRLASRFASHLEAIHVRPDPRTLLLGAPVELSVPVAADLIDGALRDIAAEAAAARDVFDAAMRRYGLSIREDPPAIGGDLAPLRQPSACWREEMGDGAVKVSNRARLFDLLILGRSGRVVDEPYGDAIEEALLTVGRPVLVAPSDPPATIGDAIAVAWNDTPHCARALAAALPFLAEARDVVILSLGDTGAPDAARHLAWYGVRARAKKVEPVSRVGTGELILAAARDHGADLLVMGGYGRAPWRETLFGGATRQVVGTSLLPILLAH